MGGKSPACILHNNDIVHVYTHLFPFLSDTDIGAIDKSTTSPQDGRKQEN